MGLREDSPLAGRGRGDSGARAATLESRHRPGGRWNPPRSRHMRPLSVLPVTTLALLWCVSLWLWPQLPEQIPLHFDGEGTPDRFGARSLVNWFLLPGLGTLLVALFSFVLPPWIVALARRDSPYLNVPQRAELSKLSPEARVRAVQPVGSMLMVIAAEVALLFTLLQFGTARVASGAWQKLPTTMAFGAVGVLVATTLVWLPLLNRGVRRELERQG